MKGQWHGGKGPATRPEGEAGNFGRGFEGIDWGARERAAAAVALDSVSMEPPACALLVAAVDVAENRIEVEIEGWAP